MASIRSATYLTQHITTLRKKGKVIIDDIFSPDFMLLAKEFNMCPNKVPHKKQYSANRKRYIVSQWEYRI